MTVPVMVRFAYATQAEAMAAAQLIVGGNVCVSQIVVMPQGLSMPAVPVAYAIEALPQGYADSAGKPMGTADEA
jgi:hypothetical protein